GRKSENPLPKGALAVGAPLLTYGSLSPVTGLTLEAAIDPTRIALRTLTAEWQGASLGGAGVLPWRVVLSELQPLPGSSLARWVSALPPEPARASVTARADNISDAVLKDFVTPDRLQQVQGGAFVTIALDADRLSLERIGGTAVLDRAWVTLAGVPFYQNVPTRLRIED